MRTSNIIAILAVVATLIVGFKSELFYGVYQDQGSSFNVPNANDEDSDNASARNIELMESKVGEAPIYHENSGLSISSTRVSSNGLTFYKIQWSLGDRIGSEAIKEGSFFEVPADNAKVLVSIIKIDANSSIIYIQIKKEQL